MWQLAEHCFNAIEEFAEKVQDLEETVKGLLGENELLKGDATVGEMIALVEWLVEQKVYER